MRLSGPLTLSIVLALIAPAGALAQTSDMQGVAARVLDRICDQNNGDRDARIGEQIMQRLSLNDQQKGLLKTLGDARAKGRSETKAALCSPRPAIATFKDREAFWETLLTARLSALKAVRPATDAFYDSLDQTQKSSFDRMVDRWAARKIGRRADENAGRRDFSDDGQDYGSRDSRDRDDYRSRGDWYSDHDHDRYRDRDADRCDHPGYRSWRHDRSYDRDRDYYGRDERPRDQDLYRPHDYDDMDDD